MIKRILAVAKRAQDASEAKRKSDYKWDWKAEEREINQLCDEMNAINKAAGPGLVIGRLLQFSVADGHAFYIVTKVRKNDVVVEWIPMGDDYFSPAVGLSADKTKWIVLRSTAEMYAR